MADGTVVTAGHHPEGWEALLYAYGSPLILIAFVAALAFPNVRRFFERTPFGSFALFCAAANCVAKYWLTAFTELSEQSSPSAWLKGIDWETLYEKFGRGYFCVILLEAALALFLVAQIRRLVTKAHPPPHPIDLASLVAGTDEQRSGSIGERLTSFLRTPFVRARIVRDFNFAATLLREKAFSPLGFAVQLAVIAGALASIIGLPLSHLGSDTAATSDDFAGSASRLLFDAIKPFESPAVLLFLSWLGSWSLVGPGVRLGPVRRLYLTIDSAISFWPIMAVALAATLSFPSVDAIDHISEDLTYFLSDVLRSTRDWFGDDPNEWYQWWRDTVIDRFANELIKIAIFGCVWLAPLWLVAIRLLRTPRIVGSFLGSGDVLAIRHAVVFLALSGAILAVLVSLSLISL